MASTPPPMGHVQTSAAGHTGNARGIERALPILAWLPSYRRRWLSADLLAGATIWGLLIPEQIAYAGIAGLPPQAGLYTLLATLWLYAIFGTSRQLVVAGTSAAAVLLASSVGAMQPTDAGEYAKLSAAFVILIGLVFIGAGLARLGFITQFLSRPVMDGFISGLAIFIMISQLPKLFGLESGDGDSLRKLWDVVTGLGDTHGLTAVVGIGALLLLFAMSRFTPRIPGGLVILALGIAAGSLGGLADHGVDVVGKVPAGLPDIARPGVDTSQLWILVPSAIGAVLVIFSEALGAGNAFASKHNYRLNPSQEMVAIGVANVGSGLVGGLPAGGSLSQTAVNDQAGARSELSAITASALALVVVIALTGLFTDLPEAVLGALIIHAVSGMVKLRNFREFFALSRAEFWLGMVTLAGVLIIDVLPGLMIGVGLSLVLVISRITWPRVAELGATANGYRDTAYAPAAEPPSIMIFRPEAPLFYANAATVTSGIHERFVTADPPPAVVLVDVDASQTLDITTARELDALIRRAHTNGVRIGFVHLHEYAREMAHRAAPTIGSAEAPEFGSLESAVAWAETQAATPVARQSSR